MARRTWGSLCFAAGSRDLKRPRRMRSRNLPPTTCNPTFPRRTLFDAGARSGGKFVVPRAGEGYDAQARDPNRKFQTKCKSWLIQKHESERLTRNEMHDTRVPALRDIISVGAICGGT